MCPIQRHLFRNVKTFATLRRCFAGTRNRVETARSSAPPRALFNFCFRTSSWRARPTIKRKRVPWPAELRPSKTSVLVSTLAFSFRTLRCAITTIVSETWSTRLAADNSSARMVMKASTALIVYTRPTPRPKNFAASRKSSGSFEGRLLVVKSCMHVDWT